MTNHRFLISICLLLLASSCVLKAQTITGAWRGKIGAAKAELKLVKKGDSLVGTSYYYTSKNHYRRFAVRGYFDANTNYVVWWDDVLLDEKGSGNFFAPNKDALLSMADFNCPGENVMKLEGSSTERDDKEHPKGNVQLEKIPRSSFSDEWDYVLENYFVGANRPSVIDSVARLSFIPAPEEVFTESNLTASKVRTPGPAVTTPAAVNAPSVPDLKTTAPGPSSIDQKFTSRTKKLQTVIPITAKKIELRFYDNAQVDGDSIALYLNNKMIYKNIRLTEQAYTIYLQADELQDDNELVMVAENLGSIPPNTAFMVAIVGKQRYEARLFANEGTSALIRLVKQAER
ncbi:MAG: hypothetical protein QM731_17175 [Chitinophagaceae bacterium]